MTLGYVVSVLVVAIGIGWVGWKVFIDAPTPMPEPDKKIEREIDGYVLECLKGVAPYCEKENKK